MNEEMMALYRENGVNPTGGCLPMFLQFPILIVLYDVVRGPLEDGRDPHQAGKPILKARQAAVHSDAAEHPEDEPACITTSSPLMARCTSLGINLADSVRTHQPHLVDVIPYALLVLIAVGLQYVSIWQVTTRNPAAAQANQQMQQMQKYMPLIFLVLYIALPAGVGVYFIVSSLFRVGQQEWMYKHDPTIVAAISELKGRKDSPPGSGVRTPVTGLPSRGRPARPPRKGFLERMREAVEASSTATADPDTERPAATTNGLRPPGRAAAAATDPSRAANQNGARNGSGARKPQQRASGSSSGGGSSRNLVRGTSARERADNTWNG